MESHSKTFHEGLSKQVGQQSDLGDGEKSLVPYYFIEIGLTKLEEKGMEQRNQT